MREIPYDRNSVVSYARKWALNRNPSYYNFDKLGGDCTNFASQCIYAGARIMNYTPIMGWYYRSSYDRSPSWSGVGYLYNFLVNNKSVGPYAHIVSPSEVSPGDIVQLNSGWALLPFACNNCCISNNSGCCTFDDALIDHYTHMTMM